MKQYHVWIDEMYDYNVLETGHLNSVEEIDKAIGGDYNWYGVDADSEGDAIAKAKESGLQYVTPLQLQSLRAEVVALKQEIQKLESGE
jgi:hypothetical protein